MAADTYFIHETAVVENGASIGPYTRAWHFCHIMSGANIGNRNPTGSRYGYT